MKRRSPRPLLRGVVGAAMLASGRADASIPEVEPVPSRVLDIVVIPKGSYNVDEPAILTLSTEDGQVLGTRSVQLSTADSGTTRLKWEVDGSIRLPGRVHLSVAIPADDDPVTPSRSDLWAEVTQNVGETLTLVAQTYMPVMRATFDPLSPVVTSPLEIGPPRKPVYANTKGSHHYEQPPAPPAPFEVVRIDVDGPDDPTVRSVTIRLITDDPNADVLHARVLLARFPAEVRVAARVGQAVPQRFKLVIEASSPIGTRYSAVVDAVKGTQVRAVLRKP